MKNKNETKQLILKVLEGWSHLQPNMESLSARELLADDLSSQLDQYINNLISVTTTGRSLEWYENKMNEAEYKIYQQEMDSDADRRKAKLSKQAEKKI
jgi:hypothetical protein|tara:strand:- start:611 stop:904 length:294 start_codon:yes stop_codon:yes gene_type:complete